MGMSAGGVPRAGSLRPGDPRQLGTYRIVGRLGEGGMGSVYLAESADGTPVALKVIRDDLAHDAEFRRRFRSEVNRARQVPPFCTAEVLDADTEHDPPYLVIEYVDGPSLGSVVRDRGPLTPANQHGLAVGVAVALTAIHGAGVIHRDLKPSNVLLAPGSPKVIDFGIARGIEGTNPGTTTDQVLGTVAYMAPERFGPDGSGAITPAADIFAWGSVVAYAGTGRTPFGGEIAAAMAVQIMAAPPNLEGLRSPLRELVEHALAKSPAERPTARELVDRLLSTGSGGASRPAAFTEQPEVLAAAGIVPGQPTESTRVIKGEPPRDGRRGGSRLAVASLAVTVLLLAGVVAGILSGRLPVPRNAGAGPTSTSGLSTSGLSTSGLSPSAPLSPSADQSARPSTSPSPAPTPSVVPGGRLAVQDPLAAPANWDVVSNPSLKASCDFADQRYVVTLGTPGSFRCRGEQTAWKNFSVFVDVTLITPGSCAGLWFRFTELSGYALRVCENGYYFVIHGHPTSATVASIRAVRFTDRPIALNEKTRVGITAIGSTFRFFRDGALVTGWTDDTFKSGKIIPGVFQVGVEVKPPFGVAFSNIEIWSPDAF